MIFFWAVFLSFYVLGSSEEYLFKKLFLQTVNGGDKLLQFRDNAASLEIILNVREVGGVNQISDLNSWKLTKINLEYGKGTSLKVGMIGSECVNVSYTTHSETALIATVNITNLHVYGGSTSHAVWPVEKAHYNRRPFVSNSSEEAGVMEPYWLLSNGYYIYVEDGVPLFVEQKDNTLRLIAENKLPYKKLDQLDLSFTVCHLKDVSKAQEHAIQHRLGKPTAMPNDYFVIYPTWSMPTIPGQEMMALNTDLAVLRAKIISNYGLKGLFHIDVRENWPFGCFDSVNAHNASKYQNFTAFIQEIKRLNFRVSLAIDSHLQDHCGSDPNDGVKNDYFVRDGENRTISLDGSTFIDLTISKARFWYMEKIADLLEIYGIDAFQLNDVFSSSVLQPAQYYAFGSDYFESFLKESVKYLASVNMSIQTSSARRDQQDGLFVRMAPRAISWNTPSQPGGNSGLKSIIPSLLQLNILGYSFVVPDTIGGRVQLADGSLIYSDSYCELFIRWTQLTVFLPSMEFGILPWDLTLNGLSDDDEVFLITKRFIDLHAQYAEDIIAVMKEHVKTGAPVNRPLWWNAPADEVALTCDDEFLLGDKILVAPVLEEGKQERDIYLPKGSWKDGNTGNVYEGPQWLKNHPAALDVLPYFLNVSNCAVTSSSSNAYPTTTPEIVIEPEDPVTSNNISDASAMTTQDILSTSDASVTSSNNSNASTVIIEDDVSSEPDTSDTHTSSNNTHPSAEITEDVIMNDSDASVASSSHSDASAMSTRETEKVSNPTIPMNNNDVFTMAKQDMLIESGAQGREGISCSDKVTISMVVIPVICLLNGLGTSALQL